MLGVSCHNNGGKRKQKILGRKKKIKALVSKRINSKATCLNVPHEKG